MKNNILLENKYSRNCTGCSVCECVCPTDAIKIRLTKHGFYEPEIENEKCISCGICKKSCYKFDENIKKSELEKYKAFSAKNIDKKELETSTSGGVSIELMRECLNRGYNVVGVAYDNENEIAITKIAKTKEEIEEFKGSKYFQSYTVNAFKKIIEEKGKYAIFGTPCQIYGIKKAIEKKHDKDIIFIDLFCHGCPSFNVWKKYLEYSKKQFKTDKFDTIEFRSKVHGWHEFSFKFKKNEKIFRSKKINDSFYELFFDMNSHNEACYECNMRSSFYYTDIRLGDFWGYQYDEDREGVSAVIITSEIGKDLFGSIKNKFEIKEHTINEAILAQSYGKKHEFIPKKRKNTLELISSNKKIEDIIKIYKKQYSMKKKIRKNMKNATKILPQKIYFKIRKIMHK
ncbi:Coenzyme F420 hydrogenase/dehydrogenase, beta subunit C-terminal domain [uncultured Clostridium sp.]|uniref:Coenzyme F420 hydrogenase/dehydrogenase, beta subunit C-terminal domain n=1 Tax=uncultured Clostridium sp. TaxID=59620 RepID=UPI00260ED325|nr:Coenzyme F420 hydrogenase/dehydrogenase, beta subunit C-terminal domain [uncultured Clostridium sp.]